MVDGWLSDYTYSKSTCGANKLAKIRVAFKRFLWDYLGNCPERRATPPFWEPLVQKKIKNIFFFILGTESILYLAPPVCPIPFNLAYSTTVLHLPKMVFALKSNLKSTIYSSVVIVTPWHPLLHALCLDL